MVRKWARRYTRCARLVHRADPGGCHVVTEEAQHGLLLWIIGRRTRRTLLKSHEEWLRALKTMAEEKE